jgi:hypothetical protein
MKDKGSQKQPEKLGECSHHVKQFLGFEDPQNRVSKATQRTAPLISYIYDLVVLWYAQSGNGLADQAALQRVWYTKKASVSFEDILRTLRHASWQETTPTKRTAGELPENLSLPETRFLL